jgi:hypothetical protein
MTLEPLSPKVIQARVRAGSTAELISAETGWPLDRVIRFAEPPIAERGYIAQLAQAVELRRTGTPVTLADTVKLALADDGLTDTDVSWDAYRREDGKWIVIAAFTGPRGAMQATWTYDSAGRNLHPLDETARRLMGVSSEPIIDFITENPVAVVQEQDAEITELRPHLVSVPNLASDEDVFVGEADADDMADDLTDDVLDDDDL